MKKFLSCLLCVAMLCAMTVALAETPAAASLTVTEKKVRGNSAWTAESYPEIWLTPFFAEYIVEKNERYPAHFIHFSLRPDTSPYSFTPDSAAAVDFDTLISYNYYVMERASFEVFLEKADPAKTLSDGSDGVAVYTNAEKRRGYAMISLKDQFGGTTKLEIDVYDNTGDLSDTELGKVIQEEAERVRAALTYEELDHYWSQGVFASVELYDSYQGAKVVVDAKGLTLTKLDEQGLQSTVLGPDGQKALQTELEITDVYGDTNEAALSDGTPYLVRSTDYTSYAFFKLKEGKSRPVYLQISVSVGPDDAPAAIEAAYALVQLVNEE
ncbi:MAG: hypothetical protein LBU67_08220 [Oscillospiraceae bacterium]|jgi:hypothetical protein|nr:hypothetical protein [Oscillospiraceae bacterium]